MRLSRFPELEKIAKAPSLYDYQLVDETRGYKVPVFELPQEKQLVILYNESHDVVTSLPGFFGSSYFRDIVV